MEWAFVYLFVVLKVPVIAALWLVWWSVRAEPAPADDSGGGGGSRRWPDHPRPRPPRPPRRGPHAEAPPRAPSRTRVHARTAELSHR